MLYEWIIKPHMNYRENNDLEIDKETHHDIKTIHLPANSGKHGVLNAVGSKTDFAIVELATSVNTCKQHEHEKCWELHAVNLPGPDFTLQELEEVRTLGNYLFIVDCFLT